MVENPHADLNGSQLVRVARNQLLQLFGKTPESVGEAIPYPPYDRVNVTLRVRGVVRGSMSGVGSNLRDQIEDAVKRAASDVRFANSLVTSDVAATSVEVWLQTESQALDTQNTDEALLISLGVDGVEVEQGTHFAYYKPSVALTSAYESPGDLLSALCRKANLPRDAWKSNLCTVRRTKWIHFAESATRSVNSLIALRPSPNEMFFTQAIMRDWFNEAVGYLLSNQDSRGEICYRYDPLKDRTVRKPPNPVRSSGCAYALSLAASHSDDADAPLVSAAAIRAVDYILERKVMTGDGGAFINDSTHGRAPGGKLGTTALLTLALLTPALRSRYQFEAESLLYGIRKQQNEDGSFTCTYGSWGSAESQQNFFPGQALLACVMMSNLGDISYCGVYEKAFKFYEEHFLRSPTTAFVGWQADVWTRVALAKCDERYSKFVFAQIDWLLNLQVRNPGSLIYGSFSSQSKPSNYSTIVYVEAIARAADLAFSTGDEVRYQIYREAVVAGLSFCSSLRLTVAQGSFFPSPERAYGGSTTSLTNFVVRSDVVQHATTMALAISERSHLLKWE